MSEWMKQEFMDESIMMNSWMNEWMNQWQMNGSTTLVQLILGQEADSGSSSRRPIHLTSIGRPDQIHAKKIGQIVINYKICRFPNFSFVEETHSIACVV